MLGAQLIIKKAYINVIAQNGEIENVRMKKKINLFLHVFVNLNITIDTFICKDLIINVSS